MKLLINNVIILMIACGGLHSDAIYMGEAGPTVKVDHLEDLKKENEVIKTVLLVEMPKYFKELAKLAEKDLEKNKKIAQRAANHLVKKWTYSSNLQRHEGNKTVETVKIPFGAKLPPGAELVFFDIVDEKLAYQMVQYLKGKDTTQLHGFCMAWNQDAIKKFNFDTKMSLGYAAMTNDAICDEYGVTRLPCIIRVIDEKTCEKQYGFR